MPSLNWIGKEKIVNHDKEVPFRLLRKNKKFSLGNSENLILEGDNLEALKALMPFYYGKIKCIYIDPPYNTGEERWIYNDRVNAPKIRAWFGEIVGKEGEDLTRHDKWLCMMYPRLKLLKDLLSEDGIIFVSIDDNELHNLKILMDDIFEVNHIATFIHKNNSSKNQANLVSISTEYMLLYKKSKNGLRGTEWRIEKRGAKDIADMYNKLKQQGLSLEEIEEQIKIMYSRPKYAHLSRWNKVDNVGVFVDADLSREGGTKNYTIINPSTKKACIVPDRGWGKSKQELFKLQKDNLIYYGDEDTPPRMKVYITDDNPMVPDSLLYFDNSGDTRMIKNMFGKLLFENPKPLEMIKTVIKMSTNENDLILDSFAGSGTTAHAVLDLNKEDGGNRKFILVELEKNIAKNITAERVRRVAQGYSYKKINGETVNVPGLGGGFEYVELGEPLFDKDGMIGKAVSFEDMARYVYFTETRTNLEKKNIKGNYLGEFSSSHYFLLFNGIDKNVLDRKFLKELKGKDGRKIIYADKCLLDEEVLEKHQVVFKQIPYQVRVY